MSLLLVIIVIIIIGRRIKNLPVFMKILIHYSTIMEAFPDILKHSMD